MTKQIKVPIPTQVRAFGGEQLSMETSPVADALRQQAGQTPDPDAPAAHTTQALRDRVAELEKRIATFSDISEREVKLAAMVADLKRERDKTREIMDYMNKGWEAMKRRAEAAESTLASLRDRLTHRLASLDEYRFTDHTQVEQVEDDPVRLQAWGRWSELRFVLDLLDAEAKP